MIMPWSQRNRILVKRFNNKEQDSEVALLVFNGQIRDKIIENFNKQFMVEGDHIKNGGKISPKAIMSLIGGGGAALGLSALASGNLFMATANPATLMAIGSGYGSAVLGAGGIIAQAPFIPIAGAIMPVVAPLVAFQTITTIVILNQFKTVNQKLDNIEKDIYRIIQRSEATYIGEIISASSRISDLENQFFVCNDFTSDMIIRLSLLEGKINPLFERYNYLYSNQKINAQRDIPDIKQDTAFKQNDAYLTIVLSILDMRIDLLRTRLILQYSPGFIESAAGQLTDKVDYYSEIWTKINDMPIDIKNISAHPKESISRMNKWGRWAPKWLGGKRRERIEKGKKVDALDDSASKMDEDFKAPIDDARTIGESIKNETNEPPMNLIYWKDNNGEHSYYTNDLLVKAK